MTSKRPNIVLILADDMGFSDLGCYGSEIPTPNLDRLAARGVRFTQMYNFARCCPSRAALLTGLNPHQAGIGHMTGGIPGPVQYQEYQGFLRLDCVTVAQVLQASGYRTSMSGKWHVGDNPADPGGPDMASPRKRGFDRVFGIAGGCGNYYFCDSLWNDDDIVESEPGLLPDRRDLGQRRQDDRGERRARRAVLPVRRLHGAPLAAARARRGRRAAHREIPQRVGRAAHRPARGDEGPGNPGLALGHQPKGRGRRSLGRCLRQRVGRPTHGRLRGPGRDHGPGHRPHREPAWSRWESSTTRWSCSCPTTAAAPSFSRRTRRCRGTGAWRCRARG